MKTFNNELDRIITETNKSGIIGNEEAKKHIALACISTLNLNPDFTLSVIVEGESGTGKTSLVKSILSLFPEEKIINRSRLSKKALDHMEESLDGKVLFVEELSGNEGTYSMKIVISEHVLNVSIVEQNNGKQITNTKRLSAVGTSFISTTTQQPYDLELESRVNRIYPNSSDEHKACVVNKILDSTRNLVDIGAMEEAVSSIKPELAALERYRVVIPYADIFKYENISAMPNIYRNLKKILGSIQANTLLHQNHRDKQGDLIIASEEDYLSIRDILEEMVNPPTIDRIKLEAVLGTDEFTVQNIQDVYNVGKSEAYNKLKFFKRTSLVRDLGGGKYILNKTILPELESIPAIPAVLEYRDTGNSGHSGSSTELTDESQHTAKVPETPESVEKENAEVIKIDHLLKFDIRMMDISSVITTQ